MRPDLPSRRSELALEVEDVWRPYLP